MNGIKQIKLVLSGIWILNKILIKETGIKGFILFIKSVFISNKIFNSTSWSKNKNSPESKYVKPMALMSAVYSCLIHQKGKERAIKIIEKIMIKISLVSDFIETKDHKLLKIKDPFDRWSKYKIKMMDAGSGIYNEIRIVNQDNKKIHLRIKRCVYFDFFKETGYPELAKFICNSDLIFHASLFPEFTFHRDGSSENTLAFDNDCCEYVWELKE